MNRRQIGTWLRIATAFAVTSLGSGCALFSSGHASRPPAPPAMADEAPLPAPAPVPQALPEPAAPIVPTVAVRAEAPASAVNVFGEFDGAQRRFAAAADESGVQQHTVCDEGYDADIAVDPAGRWMAFSSTRHSEHPDIYLQRVDGTSVIQLTNDPASDVQPCFSPDGKRVAFASTRSGNWDIYVMDIDGRNIEQVTNSPAQEMHPSFSPDGTRLAYCSLSPRSDQWELWVVDLTTHQRQMIGQGLFPSWSPQKDVDRIAFQRARQRGSRWFSVWTIDLVNGEPSRPTEVAASANAAVVSPSWSPDGKRLCFSTIIEPDRSAAPTARARHDIWTCAADGGVRQRLTHGDGTNLSPVWAVDNRIYFISDRSGHENVWSIRPGGSATYTAAAGAAGHGAQKDTKLAAPKSGAAATPTAVGSADVRAVGHE
jgi:TolB protein